MTARQQLLRIIYPFWMFVTRLMNKRRTVLYKEKASPPVHSLYDIAVELNNGETLLLQEWKGKKMLLVNTASDCGYTAQYKELQQLYEKYKDRLVVLAFPSNDFKEQEKGSDEEIAQFCQVNFGVNFPLAKKSVVSKGPQQHPVFQWLTDKSKNGWNDQPPNWNFSKYLVNEQGMLTHFFAPSVTPLDQKIIKAIRQ